LQCRLQAALPGVRNLAHRFRTPPSFLWDKDTMSFVERLFTVIARAMLYVATAALLLLTFLVVLSSLMRYVYGAPFSFTEELVALLYMSSIFLALPLATAERVHVAIAVLPKKVMHLLRYPLRLLACLIMIAFCVWFTIVAYEFMAQSYNFHSRSEQAEILLWPWMAIMPVSMGFVVLIAILHLIQGIDPSAEAAAAPDSDVSLKGDAL
jgi:TRAP-type C4-dicarboxylate transport system permease small subunit